jgi:hypothetical protein
LLDRGLAEFPLRGYFNRVPLKRARVKNAK